MLGGLGDLLGAVKQARQMQEKMKQVQEDMGRRQFEAEAGDGAVQVRVNGRAEVLAVRIRSDVARPDGVAELEEWIRSALNAATRKAQEGMKAEMAQVTAGLNLPGLSQMLGLDPPGS